MVLTSTDEMLMGSEKVSLRTPLSPAVKSRLKLTSLGGTKSADILNAMTALVF